MCDFCVKPTQILNGAFADYQNFVAKCNKEDNNTEETDKTILYNGINSTNIMDLAKEDYMKQEQKQRMATDILEQELKKAEQSQNVSSNTNPKETFVVTSDGDHNYKISIDMKMVVIIILVIGIIYIYSLYLTTRSKMKYYKKIIKFKEKMNYDN